MLLICSSGELDGFSFFFQSELISIAFKEARRKNNHIYCSLQQFECQTDTFDIFLKICKSRVEECFLVRSFRSNRDQERGSLCESDCSSDRSSAVGEDRFRPRHSCFVREPHPGKFWTFFSALCGGEGGVGEEAVPLDAAAQMVQPRRRETRWGGDKKGCQENTCWTVYIRSSRLESFQEKHLNIYCSAAV